ncbi:alpha-N-acetylglucosaminidase [Bacteroidales bacterium OttesenSCG-928-A17]|nr:alpha-N-acetylglucosaminidase [Bacteroidales bacterium OttesenSCG-928-A17]
MNHRLLRIATLFLLGLVLSISIYANPADNLLTRIGGEGASGKILTAIEASGDGSDYFTITSEDNKPKIIGNSYLSVATGIHWYLKYHANILLAWNNLTTDLSQVDLPVPTESKTYNTDLKYRYYLNYCTYSYTMAFWDWERWEKEIDWMALHGINMPLALTGTEVVWRNVLVEKLGYTKGEANQFIAGSGFQAWFLMNNLEGWGGENPDSWYDQQEALQKKIVTRMRELDIEPVFAGYSGMVPSNIKAKMGWNISNPGTWCSFQRPGFLLPTDENFGKMAEYYYDELKSLYGTSKYYSMDPFHEGGNTSGVNLDAAFKAVYNAMLTYCGHSTTPQWVIQSWQENPSQEALNAINPGGYIVLDLFSDGTRKWANSYKQTIGSGAKHEFVFCMLNNFGGRTGLHGRLEKVIDEFYEAKRQFPATMLGVGATMEGSENNPVLYEILYELPWRETKQPAEEWIKNYVKVRYGQSNEQAEQAWVLLLNSVYNCTTGQQGVSESLLCARPSLDASKVSSWSTSALYYDPEDVRDAAILLLSQSDVLSGPNYEYDLVDVVRQTLADYANDLLKRIKKANTDKDNVLRNALMDRYLSLILDQDRLMNTMPDFMLGKWINDARSLGTTKEEKDLYEKNARLQVTTWGPLASANSSGLHDYSNREWGGLLKDYYYERWKLYFDKIKSGQSTPTSTAFFNMEYAWATTPTTTNPYPYTSQENPVKVAKEVFGNYYTSIKIEGKNTVELLEAIEKEADYSTNSDCQIYVLRGNTLKISLPKQDLMKVYVDLNNDGEYTSNEIYSPSIQEKSAVFEISIPADSEKGRKRLSLYSDVETGSIDFASKALCGLRLDLPLIIMDEVFSSRTVRVSVDDTNKGEAKIVGVSEDFVSTKDPVIVEAIRKLGYKFAKWTDESGNAISTDNPYTYYESEPITLKANFESQGESYQLPIGENYITFNPVLSTQDKWRMDAEIITYGESYNQWGSSLFTEGTNAFDGYKFQYYLKSGGEIMLNNSVNIDNITVDKTNGTKINFEVISDGSGTVQTRILVNDKAYAWYPYTLSQIKNISKAAKYPLAVYITTDDGTNIPNVSKSTIKAYGRDGQIIVENLNSNDICRVYTISGQEVVWRNRILPAGIYIVNVNGESQKLILRSF